MTKEEAYLEEKHLQEGENNVRQGNRRFSIGCPAFWFNLFLYGYNQIAGLGTKGGSVE